MPREFICQTFCFGYKNRRWKVGEKIMVDEAEEKLLPKWFVPVEKFKQQDLSVIGGPRVDGVLKKLEKITDTAMSPDTRKMLEKENAASPKEETEAPEVAAPEVAAPEGGKVPEPVKRGRRLGSKNK